MLSILNSTKLFNDNVDQILPNCDPLPPSSGHFTYKYLISDRLTKRGLSTDHLPTSPSPRLYWMTPNIMLAPHGTNINRPERVPNSCLQTIWHLSSLLMLKWPNFSRFFFQWTTITSREGTKYNPFVRNYLEIGTRLAKMAKAHITCTLFKSSR